MEKIVTVKSGSSVILTFLNISAFIIFSGPKRNRGWNNKISSMRIPTNMQVEFWEDHNFYGDKRSFEGFTEDVCQQLGDFDNEVSTVRITNDSF